MKDFEGAAEGRVFALKGLMTVVEHTEEGKADWFKFLQLVGGRECCHVCFEVRRVVFQGGVRIDGEAVQDRRSGVCWVSLP